MECNKSFGLVAITGASSFTGAWLCRYLAENGFEVYGLLQRASNAYEGLQRLRIELVLHSACKIAYDLSSTDGSYLSWIEANRPQVWIHHHHHMTNFRNQLYDVETAKGECVEPLRALVECLKRNGCRHIIQSGSYLEPDVSGQFATSLPYAQSKLEVWKTLASLTAEHGIKLSKIVIPNPIGPFENADRLIPSLVRASLERTVFRLQNINSRAINLPVNLLCQSYVAAITNAGIDKLTPEQWRPAVKPESTIVFVKRVMTDLIEQRLNIEPCRLASDIRERHGANENSENFDYLDVDWDNFWSWYAQNLLNNGLQKSIGR